MAFSLEEFLLCTPLYTKVELEISDFDDDPAGDEVEFEYILYNGDGRFIEGFNPIRKIETTFEISETLSNRNTRISSSGGFGQVELKCRRYSDVFMYFCMWSPSQKILMKVGQWPSLADFHIGETKRYRKLLSSEKMKEFTRAIGLAANGVGIGSFVYLRRIFEHLIQQAKESAIESRSIRIEDFDKARMDQRIKMLSTHLPSFLVEHSSMYAVLSLGVHELDEATCLEHFSTLRVGIEIILDEQLEKIRRREKISRAAGEIAQLKSKIKPKSHP